MILAALLLVTMGWSEQTGTVVVAHDNAIEGFDRTGEKKLWSAEGLESPSAMVVSNDGTTAIVLDGFANRVALVSVADGKVETKETSATPLAAAFFGRDAWVILRDRSSVLRVRDGKEVPVALDPACITANEQFVYVYSRADGTLQELDPGTAQIKRTLNAGSGGSDLELRKGEAFVLRPMIGKIVYVDLQKMTSHDVGCCQSPIDLAFDENRAWLVDPAKQVAYMSKDPGEGKSISLPAPCDRIAAGSAGVFAFDSNTLTLYRLSGDTAGKVASDVAAFAQAGKTLFWWDAKSGKLLH